jgi:hypothetical protein
MNACKMDITYILHEHIHYKVGLDVKLFIMSCTPNFGLWIKTFLGQCL